MRDKQGRKKKKKSSLKIRFSNDLKTSKISWRYLAMCTGRMGMRASKSKRAFIMITMSSSV
jgi:hypothetical protein